MNVKRIFLSVLFGVIFCSSHALAQGTTAFTYQGQLRDGGTNANGTYTMIFKLYDAVINGNQIGSTITLSPTLVNGLFSVNLDFGAGAFNGAARWLDITVTKIPDTQTLSPRVQVLPSPYALFANTANNFTGTLPASGLSGTYTNQVTFNNSANIFCSTFFGNGSGLTNLNTVPNMQVFDSNGTFIVPTNVTKILVEVWGGGGGAGGNGGGGGGGGGYGKQVFAVIPGTGYTVTVGVGGDGGDGSANGASGGASSFGALISATGGSFGYSGDDTDNGGDGGVGGSSSALINIAGGSGVNRYIGSTDGGNAGNGGSGGRGWFYWIGDRSNQSQFGENGHIPGGGGGGSHIGDVPDSDVGADGAHGRVVVSY
jgi:hypothetical protein